MPASRFNGVWNLSGANTMDLILCLTLALEYAITMLDYSWEIHQNLKIDVISNVREHQKYVLS